MPRTFCCIDCNKTFRKGMDEEYDFYLGGDGKEGSRCVYCYNKKLINPKNAIDPRWNIETADRLEHEDKIKEAVDELYAYNLPHSYYTGAEYQLMIRFDYPVLINDVRDVHLLLRIDGFRCGEIHHYKHICFSVDFATHHRVFTR